MVLVLMKIAHVLTQKRRYSIRITILVVGDFKSMQLNETFDYVMVNLATMEADDVLKAL